MIIKFSFCSLVNVVKTFLQSTFRKMLVYLPSSDNFFVPPIIIIHINIKPLLILNLNSSLSHLFSY